MLANSMQVVGNPQYHQPHLYHYTYDKGDPYEHRQRTRTTEITTKTVTKEKPSEPVESRVLLIDCHAMCQMFGINAPWARRLWLVKDICGQICAVFTWLLLLYAESVIMIILLWPQFFSLYNLANAFIYNFFAFLAFSSHARVMLTDPGAVPRGNATRDNVIKLGLKEGEVIYRCPKCVCIKPDRAHHCSVCQRCIRKMDHHCPWVNNCIGENNQKYFILFTVYIFIICCHALYMTVAHVISCFMFGQDLTNCSVLSSPVKTICLVFLLFEAVLFGIFTAVMFHSQMSGVYYDETGIEQLKKEVARWEKKSWWLSLKAVFGHPFSWRWFSPFATPRFAYAVADLHTV